jgi:hypothetical protein
MQNPARRMQRKIANRLKPQIVKELCRRARGSLKIAHRRYLKAHYIFAS